MLTWDFNLMVVIAVCSGLYLEWRNSVRQILKQSADVRVGPVEAT